MHLKKLFAFALVFVMSVTMATACSSSSTATSDETTSAPTSTSQEEVIIEEPPYEPNVLTGEQYEGDYPQEKRFACYMVNNISGGTSQNARPQWGIGDADILVEIKVEGGITRFMAMFSDYTQTPKIGPIRSARDQFFQLILPFQPLYIHIGESVVQTEYKTNYSYEQLDINLDQYGFSRDADRLAMGRATEHTAYTEASQIIDIIESYDKDDDRTYASTFFSFVPYDEEARVLTGDVDGNNSAAYKIDIEHSESYRTYFTFDEAQGKYLMSQYSAAIGGIHETVDANNDIQLSFENVLVLFTDIHVYAGHEEKDLQQVDLTSGGVGYYFCNGTAEEVRWSKGSPQGVLRILDKFGNETDVQLNTGKTYLSIVDLDMAESGFTYYATQAAADGLETTTSDTATDTTSTPATTE